MSAALLKKLHYKGQAPALAMNVPEDHAGLVAAISGVESRPRAGRDYEYVLVFAAQAKDVAAHAVAAAARLADDGVFWVAYPKKTSKRYTSDLSRDQGWAAIGALGFEPVSQVAIDEDWSALRFRRVEQIRKMTRGGALSEAGKARIARTPGRS